ncbi:MAG: hypothetical protein NW224_08480 [Leptolyngbyaceae cyanobacterium bins.302]|nr:hypothetical protein [Leptolyngbyaceae cyanobacterium bins.302]
MFNVRGLLSSGLLALLAIAPSGQQQPAPVSAQSMMAQAQASWKGLVDTIFGRKEPRDSGPIRRGGPRPPDLCWVTPTDKVWTLRPSLVWLGSGQLVSVRPKGEETVLWQPIASTQKDIVQQMSTRHVLVSQIQLQPGEYEWLFFDPTTRSLKLRVPFQVLGGRERAVITTALAELETQLKTTRSGAEEIALQQANFFAQRQLWSDALQAVYSVKSPSTELQRVAERIETEICKPSK